MKIMRINTSDRNSFYCIATNDYDYTIFVEKIKEQIHAVEDSFAYKYSLKIFTQLFQYADDLRKKYNTYYKFEYDDFKFYLYQKEMLDEDALSELYLDELHTVLKLNPDLSNYNISTLLDYDDDNMDYINRVLEDIYK